jgi:maltose alpha-D-glucosyltransferase/alpha-amylase
MNRTAGRRGARTAARLPAARREGEPLWYKDAIIYELRVGAFQDSDGDGIGDFRGLTQRLDYLRDLGVTALWLLPFYPSPLRDDGYDIADYESVHPDCGTLEDFKVFLREAHRRELRVITELVINHTSDQHPWFQRARRAPAESRWRDFYVWSTTPERYADARVIFKDFEPSNWTWDPMAKAYYWHRFFSHQPDLNFDNPEVLRAVVRVLDFWFGLGVDGLRLDAIPYLVERDGTTCENLSETHAILKELRRHVDRRFTDRMLLAEANQWPEDAVAYFGDGDECHMAFHFPVMPRLFMALYMEDRFPIIDILAQTPPIPDGCQWALFLRNHDELTLEMVTDEERDYMYRVYAYDARARINLGIRRRLAPLLGNDRRRIELMNALLLSLPGTPVIYYGDEIGMGDNIYLGDRNGVRTPMQWSSDRNAGFSRANPQRLYLPITIDPGYHYESINVEAQQDNLHSLLLWMRRVIALRKRHKAFGRGAIEFLSPSNSKVLAFIRRHETERILVVANLSRFVQYVELELHEYEGVAPVELFGQNPFPRIGALPYLLTLGPHAFYWFDLAPGGGEVRATVAAAESIPVVRWRGEIGSLVDGANRGALEAGLAATLSRRRWFGDKAGGVKALTIVEAIAVPNGDPASHLVIARVQRQRGDAVHYAIPIRLVVGDAAAAARHEHPEAVLAELEGTGSDGPTSGVCLDATADPGFAGALLELIGRRRTVTGQHGTLVASTTARFKALRGDPREALPATALAAEQSNTSIRLGDRFMLKVFRRLSEGLNPEIEMGRFLTDRTAYPNIAPFAGAIEYQVPHRPPVSVAILQGFVANEGDAWRYTLDQLTQYVERVVVRVERGEAAPDASGPALARTEQDPPALVGELVGNDLETARLLGRRVAELHQALGSHRDDPAFAPEPFGRLHQRSLYQSMRNLTGQTFRLLRERLAALPPEVAEPAGRLARLEAQVLETFRQLVVQPLSGERIRCHGDLHLGQVLRTGTDFVIIDFEGEPARPLGERRLKRSPLRDVAGMLRSYDYAAHTAARAALERGVVRAHGMPALEGWTAFWRAWVSSAFLRAYLLTFEGSTLLPSTRPERELVLRLLLLEKSVYELGYELNSRPEWVGIPVRGILDLLGTGSP